MKRKALKKTMIDVLKIIIGVTGGFFLLSVFMYSFTMLPYWTLNSFNLFEKYSEYPAGYVYGIEGLIILAACFMVYFVHEIYLENLKMCKLKNEQK